MEIKKYIHGDFQLWKFEPKEKNKKYDYVMDLIDDNQFIKKELDTADVILIYAKKNSGKSYFMYDRMEPILRRGHLDNNLIIYGRLQRQEADNAANALRTMLTERGYVPEVIKGFPSSSYIGLNGRPAIRVVSFASYQAIRGSTNNNVDLIIFDELNADNFPSGFRDTFLLSLSTLSRERQSQIIGGGNNESAEDNPLLNITNTTFDYNYTFGQMCIRKLVLKNGKAFKVVALQLSGSLFNEKEVLAEILAKQNKATYNKFFLGMSDNTNTKNLLNVPEFYKQKNYYPFLRIAINNVGVIEFYDGEINDPIHNVFKKDIVIAQLLAENYDKEKIPKQYINEEGKLTKIPFFTSHKKIASIYGYNIRYLWRVNDITAMLSKVLKKLNNLELFFTEFEIKETIEEYLIEFNPRFNKPEEIEKDWNNNYV